MTTTTTTPPRRYLVACQWCGKVFLDFTCNLPVDAMEFAPTECPGRRCGRKGMPRVRAAG